jgi:hypothetical protein
MITRPEYAMRGFEGVVMGLIDAVLEKTSAAPRLRQQRVCNNSFGRSRALPSLVDWRGLLLAFKGRRRDRWMMTSW